MHPRTLLLTTCLMVTVSAAFAQCPGHWITGPDQGQPGLEWEPSSAAAVWDPDGPGPAPPLLAIAKSQVVGLTDGHSLTLLPGLDSYIEALIVYNGSLISGAGLFQGASSGPSLVTQWDGTQWNVLGGGLTTAGQGLSEVRAFAIYNGDLVAAGAFTTAGAGPAQNIARWDGSAWHALGQGLTGEIVSLAVYSGGLLALERTTLNTEVASAVYSWDGSNWTQLGPAYLGAFRGLTVYNDMPIAAFDREHALYAWNGSSWAVFFPGASVAAQCIATCDGMLCAIAQGPFAMTWNGLSWTQTPAPNLVSLWSSDAAWITCYNGKMVFGGSGYWPYTSSTSRLSGSLWRPLDDRAYLSLYYTSRFRGPVALLPWNGRLLASWPFRFHDGSTAQGVTSWNGNDWRAEVPLGATSALAILNGAPVAAGALGDSSIPCGFKTWNGVQWVCAFPGFPGTPDAIAQYGGSLIAAGTNQYDGPNGRGIGRWTGTTWESLGGGIDFVANALLEFNGDLIVAGNFNEAAGQPMNNIARWDGSSWHPLGEGLDYIVNALAIFNGDLIAAGSFGQAGGQPANNIARWNGSSWSPLAGGLDGEALTLCLYHGMLIVGGRFTHADGGWVDFIASWDGTSWSNLGWGTDGDVYALGTFNDELIVAGNFSAVGDDCSGQQTSYRWARWTNTPSCGSADFNHDGDSGTDQDIEDFFACLAGNCCAACGSADFNGDGDTGTDEDIEAFFRVLAGASC